MTAMTLERLAGDMTTLDDEALAFHMKQLVRVFDARRGDERLAAAHLYAQTLRAWADEATAVQRYEAIRIAGTAGEKPGAYIGQVIGAGRERGGSVVKKAREKREADKKLVERLRAKVNDWRRSEINLTEKG